MMNLYCPLHLVRLVDNGEGRDGLRRFRCAAELSACCNAHQGCGTVVLVDTRQNYPVEPPRRDLGALQVTVDDERQLRLPGA